MGDSPGVHESENTPNRVSWNDCSETGWARYCHEMYPESRHETGDRECDAPGHVSCWLGSFADESTFNLYLGEEESIWEWNDNWDYWLELQENSQFWNDLAVPWVNLGVLREFDALTVRFATEQQSVRDLFSEFPFASSFLDALEFKSKTSQLSGGNVAISIYDFAYDDRGVFAFEQLQFVGEFPYAKDAT